MHVLTNPYFIAGGIPVLLILCGAVARKLVRGSGWAASDFFLGVELSLAAMGSALVYAFDLAKLATTQSSGLDERIAATAGFLVICFFLLLGILSTHQDWEPRTNNVRGQVLWLGLFANLVGSGLMTGFVLFVKGV